MMRQTTTDAWDGCPKGQLYDGARCVSETRAFEAAGRTWRAAPPPATAPAPAAPSKTTEPRILMFQDRKSRRSRGMACVDEANVTVCRPLPRY
jgi:hypothetical protein